MKNATTSHFAPDLTNYAYNHARAAASREQAQALRELAAGLRRWVGAALTRWRARAAASAKLKHTAA